MMEHNTDRLFWTLTSIIVGALLLTIAIKMFPGVMNAIMSKVSTTTGTAGNAANSAADAASAAGANATSYSFSTVLGLF